MSVTLQDSAFLRAIQKHNPSTTSVIHSQSRTIHSYDQLFKDVSCAKQRLCSISGRDHESIIGQRIAFMVENGYHYVVTLLAVLAADAIAVPLAPSFPASEIRHVLNDSEAYCLIWSSKYDSHVRYCTSSGVDCIETTFRVDELLTSSNTLDVSFTGSSSSASGGMMLYTSGTTARPKGVLLSTYTLECQAQSLLDAWHYSPDDHLLHVLPLHHIHGTVNALLTPLLAGSSIEFSYPFNAQQVWTRFARPFLRQQDSNSLDNQNINGNAPDNPHNVDTPITFFTAVPTIWARMLQTFQGLEEDVQKAGLESINRKNLRLNISGSAALPKPVRDGWTKLSGGNELLERYGMTEVGMALSCGLDNSDRISESVGWPLPFVEARLWEADEDKISGRIIELGEEIDSTTGKERQGEIQLRGPTIFKGYWRNPAATEKEFTKDGWFKTGDVAIRRKLPDAGTGKSGPWAQGSAYFIQGRQSADIIKTGGEKVSALEIERELLSLPQVEECAVVGLPSDSWGQKVVAVIVLSEETRNSEIPWGLTEMKQALKAQLVPYKIPKDVEIVTVIKRNAMGKINKKELIPTVFGDEQMIRRRSFDLREQRRLLEERK